jgi:hypothetical protein
VQLLSDPHTAPRSRQAFGRSRRPSERFPATRSLNGDPLTAPLEIADAARVQARQRAGAGVGHREVEHVRPPACEPRHSMTRERDSDRPRVGVLVLGPITAERERRCIGAYDRHGAFAVAQDSEGTDREGFVGAAEAACLAADDLHGMATGATGGQRTGIVLEGLDGADAEVHTAAPRPHCGRGFIGMVREPAIADESVSDEVDPRRYAPACNQRIARGDGVVAASKREATSVEYPLRLAWQAD